MRTSKIYHDFMKKKIDFFDKEGLKLKIIYYKNYDENEELLKKVSICDRDFISESYERLNYWSLENHNYIGFFIMNNKGRVISSVVLNIKKDLEDDHKYVGISFPKSKTVIEITMVCSNKRHRITGATKELMLEILEYFNKKNLVLSVAYYVKNPNAAKFYEKLGFKKTGKIGIYIMEKTGSKTHTSSYSNSSSNSGNSRAS